MTAALLIILGVAAAGAGGELFVRGSVSLSMRMRIAPGIVGATVVAFATSSPELSVGVNAALEGAPEISLGDALGSNVVNIALILGLALALAGATPRRADLNRDLPVALIAPLITLGLAADGTLGRVDGLILLGCFTAWLAVTVRQAARERDTTAGMLGETDRRWIARDVIVGLVLLILAGRLIVIAAQDIGEALGWDTFTVGAVMIAVGTSTPELATTITARLRGHDEVSVGTVLGSNIFNGLLIVGMAAAIAPIHVAGPELWLAIGTGVLSLLLVLPGRSDRLGRGRGVALLLLYGLYLITLLNFHSR
jgi:cation:H+ antiporter